MKYLFFILSFITRINAQWLATLTGAGGVDVIRSIVTTESDEFYILGYSHQASITQLTDATGRIITLPFNGGYSSFLAKFAFNGTFLWRAMQDGASYDKPDSNVAVDASGGVYISFASNGINPIVSDARDNVVATFTKQGSINTIVCRYLSNGSLSWATRMGFFGTTTGTNNQVLSLAISQSGNVAVSGSGFAPYNFMHSNGQLAATLDTGFGTNDGFTAVYSPNGTYLWGLSFSSNSSDRVVATTFDSSDNMYVAGSLGGNLTSISTIAGTQLRNFTLRPNAGFVAKFSPTATLLWISLQESFQDCRVLDVTVDSFDNPIVTGTYMGGPMTISNSSGVITHSLRSLAAYNQPALFLISYSSKGNVSFATRVDAGSSISPTSVRTDSNGNIIVVGVAWRADTYIYAPDGNTVAATITGFIANSFSGIIIKYTRTGQLMWYAFITGSIETRIWTMAVLPNDDLLVGGTMNSQEITAYNARQEAISSIPGPNDIPTDGFVFRYTANGSVFDRPSTVTLGGQNTVDLRLPRVDFPATSSASRSTTTSVSGSMNGSNGQISALSDSTGIIAGVAAGGLLILIGIWALLLMRNRRKLTYVNDNAHTPNMVNLTTTAYTQNYQTLLATTHEISIPAFLERKWETDFLAGPSIAKGGGGTLYTCAWATFDLAEASQRQPLAIKVMDMGGIDSMPERKKLAFIQEISLMHKFRDHPLFCRVYAYSLNPAAIVMRLYPLGDMDHFIHGKGAASNMVPYSKFQVTGLFKLLCQAIQFMHEQDIAHCDIKPANVLLETGNMSGGERVLIPILTDFGIAQIVTSKSLGVGAFQVSELVGASVSYAAPDVFRRFRMRTPLNSRTNSSGLSDASSASARLREPTVMKAGDVYALGISLLEMLKRKHAWD